MKFMSIVCVACLTALVAGCVISDEWTFDGERVTLPHTWNAADGADGGMVLPYPGHNAVSSSSYSRGRHIYTRTLPEPKRGKRYFVRCLGACEQAEVIVNGWPIGKHDGAFTAFTFEITEALLPGDNRLEIAVDNSYNPHIPPNEGDFTMFGGLYRDVEIIEKPMLCIDPREPIKVEANPDTGHVVVIARRSDTGENFETEFDFPEPELWSPEHPHLYSVTLRMGTDEEQVTFGFRKAEWREDGFYLNGVRRQLHGVCMHQDAGANGWAASADDEERDVLMLKELGADAVRTSHYPRSPRFYDLCDKHGILVWTELPIVDEVPRGDKTFRTNSLVMAREMVTQHRNHPSIICWGAFNEVYQFRKPDGSAEDVLREVRDLIHQLDPSRPVAGASNGAKLTLNAVPDVLGMNLYPGWYGSYAVKMGEEIARAAQQNKRSTVGVTEYGAGGSIHQHGDATERCQPNSRWHTEEYQAFFHATAYKCIKDNPLVWGSFTWVMFDLASDSRHEGERHGINDKGLVTRDRANFKDAYYLYKANWSPKPVLHLVGSRLTTTRHASATVMGFSNCGAVTLKVNGQFIATQEPDAVCTVRFNSVPLAPGENTIELSTDHQSTSTTWIRQ